MHNRVVLLSTVLASAPSSKSRGASEQLVEVESGSAKWSKSIDGAVQRRTCLDMLMQKKEDSKMQRTKPSTKSAGQAREGGTSRWGMQHYGMRSPRLLQHCIMINYDTL